MRAPPPIPSDASRTSTRDPGLGERHRGREPVRARADHDRVGGTHAIGVARARAARRGVDQRGQRGLDEHDPPPGAGAEPGEEHEREEREVRDEPGDRGGVAASEHPDGDPAAGREDGPGDHDARPQRERRVARGAERLGEHARPRVEELPPDREEEHPAACREELRGRRGIAREPGEHEVRRDEVGEPDDRLPRARDREREGDEAPATRSFRPAPIAWPTRIAPALAMPNAGMNATEFTWMTAMSAASGVVPSPATTTFVKNAKARNSRNQLRPEGTP